MENLGIYIHIPFCRQKCAYCDFYSEANSPSARLDAYTAALEREIAAFFFTPGSHTADSVYIGGGTPSILGGKRLSRILKALSKRVNISRMAEITLECNPESVEKSLLKEAKSAGVNRVSLGVQSARESELAALGRVHTFEQARAAADLIRKYCTDNLSIDLMYGLPGQTLEHWRETLEKSLSLAPRHISCYALKLEQGTPMHALAPILPDGDEQADMYLFAVDFLAQNGFSQYEISNFAKPGMASRHNMKYWTLAPYVGLGCSAHSFYGGKRFSTSRDLDGYLKHGPATENADDEAYFERVGEYIMLGLRTVRGISPDEVLTRFGVDFEPFARTLGKYRESGHASFDGDNWRLTPKGFLVSNVIIGQLLECFEAANG